MLVMDERPAEILYQVQASLSFYNSDNDNGGTPRKKKVKTAEILLLRCLEV